MMKRTCILLIFIAASMAAYSQKISGTDTEAIDRAYLEQDISTLISFHTSAPDLKKKIETIEEIFKEKKAVSVGGGRGAW